MAACAPAQAMALDQTASSKGYALNQLLAWKEKGNGSKDNEIEGDIFLIFVFRSNRRKFPHMTNNLQYQL